MSPKKTSTKKGGKPRRKGIPDEDPPVVVGGGNSVDITFDIGALGSTNPPKGKKSFRQQSDINSVLIDNGLGTQLQLNVKKDKFKVSFFS